jgi:hypothetical protein
MAAVMEHQQVTEAALQVQPIVVAAAAAVMAQV